jgi:SAM-dependent methyltransferase
VASSPNESGLILSSANWLEAHHKAKLPERQAFAERLAEFEPRRILDIGCGVGLWLDLLNDLLPDNCEFIGLDADQSSLDRAAIRARNWKRKISFQSLDINADLDLLPEADMTLAFNVFCFADNPAALLSRIAAMGGSLAIRQYDGDAIRFGPMDTSLRSGIENSLRASFAGNRTFMHYDLDRAMKVIADSSFAEKTVSFEIFERTAPFSADVHKYYKGMLEWTLSRLSSDTAEAFRAWLSNGESAASYFFEVDLVGVLCSS